MTTSPFKAVLLQCPDDHYEATTHWAWRNIEHGGNGNVCGRCGKRLRLVKIVTITPAQPIRFAVAP